MLVNCFIVCCLRFFIVTKHEDVLVIGFHEIALTGNLCHRPWVAAQVAQLLGVGFVDGLILGYLLLHVGYLHVKLHAAHETVLVDKTNENHAHH